MQFRIIFQAKGAKRAEFSAEIPNKFFRLTEFSLR